MQTHPPARENILNDLNRTFTQKPLSLYYQKNDFNLFPAVSWYSTP